MIIRAAIGVLASQLEPFGGVVGRPRAPLVLTVHADEETPGQWMIGRGEAMLTPEGANVAPPAWSLFGL